MSIRMYNYSQDTESQSHNEQPKISSNSMFSELNIASKYFLI